MLVSLLDEYLTKPKKNYESQRKIDREIDLERERSEQIQRKEKEKAKTKTKREKQREEKSTKQRFHTV